MQCDAVLGLLKLGPVSVASWSIEPLLGLLEARGKLRTLVEVGPNMCCSAQNRKVFQSQVYFALRYGREKPALVFSRAFVGHWKVHIYILLIVHDGQSGRLFL